MKTQAEMYQEYIQLSWLAGTDFIDALMAYVQLQDRFLTMPEETYAQKVYYSRNVQFKGFVPATYGKENFRD